MDIEDQAKKVAELIAQVRTEDRGNLLVLAGNHLKEDSQWFTGNLIASAGMEYGLNPNAPGHPNFK